MNDKESKKIIKETISILGKGIGSLINIFDPEIVILSGGIRETGKSFLNQIKKALNNMFLFQIFLKLNGQH